MILPGRYYTLHWTIYQIPDVASWLCHSLLLLCGRELVLTVISIILLNHIGSFRLGAREEQTRLNTVALRQCGDPAPVSRENIVESRTGQNTAFQVSLSSYPYLDEERYRMLSLTHVAAITKRRSSNLV